MLKTFFQQSGWKVLLWAFLGWLATSIPIWASAIVLPDPWDKVVTGFASFVSGAIRLVISFFREPTVDATKLPMYSVEEHATKEEIVKVAAAKARKE